MDDELDEGDVFGEPAEVNLCKLLVLAVVNVDKLDFVDPLLKVVLPRRLKN